MSVLSLSNFIDMETMCDCHGRQKGEHKPLLIAVNADYLKSYLKIIKKNPCAAGSFFALC